MNKNLFVAAAIFAAVLIAIVLFRMNMTNTGKNTTVKTVGISPSAVPGEVFGVYIGDLPCADCEGIDVVLTLNKDETYTMSNVYRGRDVAPYIEKGKWYILRGDATNPDATVYQLISGEDGLTKQNYLLEGEVLKQLDQELNLLDAPFDTSLKKRNV